MSAAQADQQHHHVSEGGFTASSSCLRWEVDGEQQGSWHEAVIDILPGALQLCV